MSRLDELRVIVRNGSLSGAWSDEQVRAFENRCSAFIGQHGDALLAVVDAAKGRMWCSQAPGYSYRMDGDVAIVLPCNCPGCKLAAAVARLTEEKS